MTCFKIVPVPKPRMTQKDKKRRGVRPRPAVARYNAFKQEVGYKMKGVELDGAHLIFWLPMPKSWSKAKRNEMNYQPHRQTPDLSNLIKALEDALCANDSYIASYGSTQKYWTEGPGFIAILPSGYLPMRFAVQVWLQNTCRR